MIAGEKGRRRAVRDVLRAVPEGARLAGAALAVVVTGALLVWFLVFSGLTGPAQFVYGWF